VETTAAPSEVRLHVGSFAVRFTEIKDATARQYDEAFHGLLLLAFLQKVVDSDALVLRRYAQGRGSVDMCVVFKGRRFLVEIK
jgi:hypothetical protein